MGAPKFEVKDSGERKSFAGGMVRDVTEGKVSFHRVMDGPMLERWAQRLTDAEKKYPDPLPGVANWTLARGDEEYHRFRESAFRHFIQWFKGETDEDHAAAVFFNINGAEYVKKVEADRGATGKFLCTIEADSSGEPSGTPL